MSDLADDIARIAALRGKKAEDYQEAERERRLIGINDISCAFVGRDITRHEVEIFDRLPAKFRELVRNSPVHMSPIGVHDLIRSVGVDGALGALQHFMPEVARQQAIKHWGNEHPQAQVA